MFRERRIVFISLFSFTVLALFGCQSPRPSAASAWLPANSPAWVHFPLGHETEQYTFSADPSAPTTLTFYSLSPGLAYTAELRDRDGQVIAILSNALPHASLSVGPGSDLYEVILRPSGAGGAGALALTVSSSGGVQTVSSAAVSPPAAAEALPVQAEIPCVVASASGLNVNVRSGPGLEHTIIGVLPAGGALATGGRSANGWYRVETGGGQGWVSGSVAALNGSCDRLPLVGETEPLHLVVDREGWNRLDGHLSPGDTADLVQVAVTRLQPQPPDNYAEFTLTLTCDGQGVEAVRWGAPGSPAFPCGQTITLPFMLGSDRQQFAVAMPENAAEMVQYSLLVVSR